MSRYYCTCKLYFSETFFCSFPFPSWKDVLSLAPFYARPTFSRSVHDPRGTTRILVPRAPWSYTALNSADGGMTASPLITLSCSLLASDARQISRVFSQWKLWLLEQLPAYGVVSSPTNDAVLHHLVFDQINLASSKRCCVSVDGFVCFLRSVVEFMSLINHICLTCALSIPVGSNTCYECRDSTFALFLVELRLYFISAPYLFPFLR